MIALDTNVLVRYLVDGDAEQVQAARTLLESLAAEHPAFICREVMIELAWVLSRQRRTVPASLPKTHEPNLISSVQLLDSRNRQPAFWRRGVRRGHVADGVDLLASGG